MASQSQSPLPIHLCFFLTILLMFISFSWYSSYEALFEGLFDSMKLVFIASPVILLVALHLISTFDATFGRSSYFSDHQAGGSTPWGVGLVLVLLFFLLSYQSDLRERWLPVLSR